MKLIPLLLALLGGCTLATANETAPATCSDTPIQGLDREELTRVDVRGTARSIELTLQDIERLSPERRAEVVEAYRVLSVNCPFTRASMQLPFALHDVVIEIDAGAMDPLVQRDWANLQRGLTTHVAVVRALGGDLALPAPGDHLYGLGDALLVDRDALLDSPDPIAATMPLIGEITNLGRQLDGLASERIEVSRHEVDSAIGQATLGLHLGGWENALRRIEPFVHETHNRARIEAMIEALSSWGSQGC
jgi:hypothetical protein